MRIFREPFIHFLIIGAAVFVLNFFFSNDVEKSDNQIVVDKDSVHLIDEKVKKEAPGLSPGELKKRVDIALNEKIKQEILYREGLAVHLDKDDVEIKKRIAYKMNLLAVARINSPPVTPNDIEKYYTENIKKYIVPKTISFRHILFSSEKRGERAASDCKIVLEKIHSGELKNYVDAQSMGDPLTVPALMRYARFSLIEKIFGIRFAKNLELVENTGWVGGVVSRYGVHLVEITKIKPKMIRPLDKVYPQIKATLENIRDQKIYDNFYEKIKKKYSIVIEE